MAVQKLQATKKQASVVEKNQTKPRAPGTGRGGLRPGGGRPKGMRNKKTAALLAGIEASGLTPLEFMTSTYRNSKLPVDLRLDAAKAAAPYVHSRLAQLEVSGPGGGPIPMVTVHIPVDPTEAAKAYLSLMG